MDVSLIFLLLRRTTNMKYVLFIFITTLSVFAFGGPGQSNYVDISNKRIQLIQGGTSRLFIYDVAMNDSDCDAKTTPVIIFNSGDLGKEMYSMVLAAKATSKPLTFIAGSCIDIGGSTYPSITSIYMQ